MNRHTTGFHLSSNIWSGLNNDTAVGLYFVVDDHISMKSTSFMVSNYDLSLVHFICWIIHPKYAYGNFHAFVWVHLFNPLCIILILVSSFRESCVQWICLNS